MAITGIKPGDKVDIRLVSAVNSHEDGTPIDTYLSSIFDISDNDEIVLTMPTLGGKMVLLNEGLRYEFVFNGGKNGMYKAEGIVTKRFKQDMFYLLGIELTTKLQKFQRREYYRMECSLPVIFQAIDEELLDLPSVPDIKEALANEKGSMRVRGMGTILDLSGGGTRFISSAELEDVNLLLMQFQMIHGETNVGMIDALARKVSTNYKPEINKYEHRMQFIIKDDRKREAIIKYIFDEERRLRKKD